MRYTHQERIDFIYRAVVLGESLMAISKDAQQKYTTVYSIVKEYKKHGRTNRQLNYQEKVSLLGSRAGRDAVSTPKQQVGYEWVESASRVEEAG